MILRKLQRLKIDASYSPEKIDILNFSNLQLPANIIKTLEIGLTEGTGGRPDKNGLLLELEKFISKLNDNIHKYGLDSMKFLNSRVLFLVNLYHLRTATRIIQILNYKIS